MTILFVVLIILASFILGLFVLIQNPKGGGLAGTFGGISTQFMGVKQTNDVLERGTWLFAGIVGVLCLFASFFIPETATSVQINNSDKVKELSVPASGAPQQNTKTLNLGGDSGQ